MFVSAAAMTALASSNRYLSVNQTVGQGEDQGHNADSVDGRAAQVERVVAQHCDAADADPPSHSGADGQKGLVLGLKDRSCGNALSGRLGELQQKARISSSPLGQELSLACVGRFICVVIADVDFPVVTAFKAIGPLRSEVPIGQAATVACYDVTDVNAAGRGDHKAARDPG